MKTAISIWEEETFFAPQDVMIVGSGFLGLWCAFELKTRKPHSKITILEAGVIPTGASTRNAGFACFGSPTEMLYDANAMGEDKMWSIVEMRFKGIQKIRQYFTDDVIDFDRCGGYECFKEDRSQVNEVNDKLNWLNEGMQKITGLSKSFQWSNNKLKEFGFESFTSMIENTLEGGLHSGKLLQALIKKVQSLGVSFLTGIEIVGWEKDRSGVSVYTSTATFKTNQLLVCANALSSTLIKDFCIEPARGQVLVTEPISDLKLKGTFHYDEGFYYFRNVGNRILIGGARNTDFATENTNELLLNNNIQAGLERFVSTHLLPKTSYSISHRWSGIMGFSESKLPVIKEVEKGVYAAIACNGMGVALSPIIAEQVCSLMC